MSLITQPDDIIRYMCQYLNLIDVMNLKQTSKNFFKVDTYIKNKLEYYRYYYNKYKDKYSNILKLDIQKDQFNEEETKSYASIPEYFSFHYLHEDYKLKYGYESFELTTYNETQYLLGAPEAIVEELLCEITGEIIKQDTSNEDRERYERHTDEKRGYVSYFATESYYDQWLNESEYEEKMKTRIKRSPKELKRKIKQEKRYNNIFKYFVKNYKLLYKKYKNLYTKELKQHIIKNKLYEDYISKYFSLLDNFDEFELWYSDDIFYLTTYNINKVFNIDNHTVKLLTELTGRKIIQEEYLDTIDVNNKYVYRLDEGGGYISTFTFEDDS